MIDQEFLAAIKRHVKAQLAQARKEFDKNPNANNWNSMLVWSFTHQQIMQRSGAEAVCDIYCMDAPIANLPKQLAEKMFPGQSLATLIRS